MTIGDRFSKYAQNIFFPVLNILDSNGPKMGTKVCNVKNGIKCIYNNKSLDKLVIWEQWYFNEYDDLDLPEDSNIVEIGAHIGTSTVDYAKRCINGHVYAIEALPDHFDTLNRNIKLNGINNVSTFNYAIVGDNLTNEIEFSINPYNSAGHSLYGGTMTNSKKIKVSALSIERFIKINKIGKINLLHIDVEGAEYEILLNMSKELINSFNNVVLEYHDALQTKHKYFELIELFKNLGFKTKIKRSLISKLLKLETGVIIATKN